jgi:hypothetical protein
MNRLIALILVSFFSFYSCKESFVGNNNDLEHFHIKTSTKDVKLIIDKDHILVGANEISGVKIGRQIELDSNFIVRKEEWYHGMEKPFFVCEYVNEFFYSIIFFDVNYLDTSLITPPTFNYIRHLNYLYLEIIPNYPSKIISIELKTSNPVEQYKGVRNNNVVYFKIDEKEVDSILNVEFQYFSLEDDLLKKQQIEYNIDSKSNK